MSRWKDPQWPEGHKRCTKCGEMRVFAQFGRYAKGRFGLQAQCKECTAVEQKVYWSTHKETLLASTMAHYLAHRTDRLAKMREYRKTHKKTIAAREKKYKEAHREAVQARQKEYRIKHRESLREQKKKYYVAHKETLAIQHQLYQKTHKETLAIQRQLYREARREILAAQQRAYVKTSMGKVAKKADRQKRRSRARFAFDMPPAAVDFRYREEHGAVCYLTGFFLLPGAVTWDHVIPLHYGGTHDVWNLYPASRSANNTKQGRIVYFDLATKKACFTIDPSPGGVGPTGEIWRRLPLVQPTMNEMEEMISVYRSTRKVKVA